MSQIVSEDNFLSTEYLSTQVVIVAKCARARGSAYNIVAFFYRARFLGFFFLFFFFTALRVHPRIHRADGGMHIPMRVMVGEFYSYARADGGMHIPMRVLMGECIFLCAYRAQEEEFLGSYERLDAASVPLGPPGARRA